MERQSQQQPRKRWISRLTLKIFAVNGVALVVLAFGLIYLGQYESNLIAAEQESLVRQARIYAGAIAESAQVHGPMLFTDAQGTQILMYDRLSRFPARKMIRRLGQTTLSRIRLYDYDGSLMGDSDWLSGPVGFTKTGPSSRKGEDFLRMPVETSLNALLDILPSSSKLEIYPEESANGRVGYIYPDVAKALKGEISSSAWWHSYDGMSKQILLSAAAPVQNMKAVMGAVYLTREGQAVHEAIRQMQRDVLMLFLMALAVTFLLSLYLSGAIARPMRKLARAAERVQRGMGRDAQIPDLSRRRDEIGDMSVAFRTMTDALSQRLDSIERFAADVAHELKNPLTSLRSAVETVAVIKSEEDRKKLMRVILQDVERLDMLITDISKASRLDAELSRENMDIVDLRELLQSVAAHYTVPTDSNAAHPAIILNLPAETISMAVKGLGGRLGQVFDNLLSNAVSFSKTEDTITVSAEKQGTQWYISVTDQGPGLPDAKLDTIFDRFYSERPTGEEFGKHSGLGLAICKQIIAVHHGRIFAENVYDKNRTKIGARFTVVLDALD